MNESNEKEDGPRGMSKDDAEAYANSGGENGHGIHKSRSFVAVGTTPWFVWPVYAVSMISGASSAAITKSLTNAAPLALASWRHQVTSLILLPGFVWQWIHFSKSDRRKYVQPKTLGILFIASLGLAGHFGSYIWALDHTSMTHCLFLTCLSPIFVAIYTKLSGGRLLAGEVGGVFLGLVGAAILAAGTGFESNEESSTLGDLLSLFSAVCMAAYLIAGKKLRGWMPLFVYQFPVSLAAAIILAGVSAVAQKVHWTENEVSGLFAWISKEYWLGTVLLGFLPGVLGHGGYSIVLKYASPLLVPTGLSLQPIVGSAIGWAVGEESVPGVWTCLGGFVTFCGTLWVSYAGEANKAKLKAKGNQSGDEYRPPAGEQGGNEGTRPLLQPSELP